jgi:hypothetical protein
VVSVGDAAELDTQGQRYDLVMLLEVLEHSPAPHQLLRIARQLARRYLLLSVPWEPYFCGLNFLRGKNLSRLGNDPEHIQHWTRQGFTRFAASAGRVVASPFVFPWTMLLVATVDHSREESKTSFETSRVLR